MMKISNFYIDEAVRIRKSYITNLEQVLSEEKSLFEHRDNIAKIRDEMEDVVLNSDRPDISNKLILNNKLNEIEIEIEKIQKKIQPFHNNIESLRTDADRLYVSISEKYPGITPEEIKEQIGDFL